MTGFKNVARRIAEMGAPPANPDDAIQAASKSLHDAKSRTDEVQQIVTVMDREWDDNHFIERLNMFIQRGAPE